jgi:hypothetical protein
MRSKKKTKISSFLCTKIIHLDAFCKIPAFLDKRVNRTVLEIYELVKKAIGKPGHVAFAMEIERDECIAADRYIIVHKLELK